MKIKSLLYKKLDNNKVQCKTCNHYCVIDNGKYGFCGVRKNIDGTLYFMHYNQAVAENVDPVEKKPLYYFLAGTKTLTIASAGCNFSCKWCQNADISQVTKSDNRSNITKISFELSPKRVVQDAFLAKCLSISYSYTEPTIYLEYALDVMKLARDKGLKNIWVSNGFMTDETLKLIIPYLDAINIDLKSLDDKKMEKFTCGKVKPTLKNIQTIYKNKIHLEITTLVVPSFNDNKSELIKIARYILDKLGPETPWHVSQYRPAYKMTQVPVSNQLFTDIKHIAHNMGLKNVYIGNV